MASLEHRAGKYRVVFRFGGKKSTRSLKTKSERAATSSLARWETICTVLSSACFRSTSL